MKGKWMWLIPLLGVMLIGTIYLADGRAVAASWQAKVDPWVLSTAAEGETEFIVFLTEQADLSGAAPLETKLEKGIYVYERLTEAAARTQPAVIEALMTQGVEFRPYWVANMIWVRGGLDTVEVLAGRSDVARIYANPAVRLEEPAANPAENTPETIEWNITKVGAPTLWDLGYTGQGAVIAGQDTGYDWDHPALKNQYRGWNGAAADHNYNWHDAIHSGGGVCGADSPEPCDDYNHGTHTMGTMVGDDSGTNQIGMAPGARWMGCRNMNVGVGTPTTYSECFQWFIAPTDLNDQNPDPAMAPHVINNSWSCPESEGCTDPNVMLTVVNNTRAAGIAVVVSAGNDGSLCSTVNTPAAIYESSFSVGATDSSDNIAGFSSRGPVAVDGSDRLKPNVSAPGVSIRSSVRNGLYQSGWSGTSMAAPHVAGLIGLLISVGPALAGEVDVLEDIIEGSALARTTTQECGGVPGSQIPNNTYGFGRIDAVVAYNSLATWPHSLEVGKSASTALVTPGDVLTYTLAVTHTHLFTSTTNVVMSDTLPVSTTFLSATEPYTFDGTTVTWERDTLGLGETWQVELVVMVDESAVGVIENSTYSASSSDVPAVAGDPVTTIVTGPSTFWIYLPAVLHEPAAAR